MLLTVLIALLNSGAITDLEGVFADIIHRARGQNPSVTDADLQAATATHLSEDLQGLLADKLRFQAEIDAATGGTK